MGVCFLCASAQYVCVFQSQGRHSSLVFSMEAVSCTWQPCVRVCVCVYALWKQPVGGLHYILAFKYMHLPISSIYLVSFSRSLHMHMNKYIRLYMYVCMCVCVCVCVCGWVGGRVCGGGTRLLPSRIYCCSPLWPKVNGWRISPVFSPSIVWGSSGSVLDSDGSSVRGALNHSKTPHNNISIVYLFSLFSPRLVGGEKRKSKRAEDSFSQDLNCWRNCLWSPLVSGIS